MAWLAAESLQYSGRREEALAAFERVAVLWESLAEFVPAVRCRRSIARLVFVREPERALDLMRDVLTGLQDSTASARSAIPPATAGEPEEPAESDRAAELAAELAETDKQLDRMVKQAAQRAKAAAGSSDLDED